MWKQKHRMTWEKLNNLFLVSSNFFNVICDTTECWQDGDKQTAFLLRIFPFCTTSSLQWEAFGQDKPTCTSPFSAEQQSSQSPVHCRVLCAPELPAQGHSGISLLPCSWLLQHGTAQLWGIWAFRGTCTPSDPEGLSSSHWSAVQATHCTSWNWSRRAEKAICCHRNSRTLYYCAGRYMKILLFGLFPGKQIENC